MSVQVRLCMIILQICVSPALLEHHQAQNNPVYWIWLGCISGTLQTWMLLTGESCDSHVVSPGIGIDSWVQAFCNLTNAAMSDPPETIQQCNSTVGSFKRVIHAAWFWTIVKQSSAVQRCYWLPRFPSETKDVWIVYHSKVFLAIDIGERWASAGMMILKSKGGCDSEPR